MANVQRDLLDDIRRLKERVRLLEGKAMAGPPRPWLPLPVPLPESMTSWPSTTSTSWATIARSRGWVQHPKVRVRAAIGLDAGTSGQLRLVVAGTAVATGSVDTELIATADVPSYTYGTEVEVQLQAQRTAGTGDVYGMTRYLYGSQT